MQGRGVSSLKDGNMPDNRGIFVEARLPLYYADASGRLLCANDAFARLFGHASASDMPPSFSPWSFIDDVQRARFLDGLQCDGEVHRFEAPIRHPDGSALLVTQTVWRVASEDGLAYAGSIEVVPLPSRDHEALLAFLGAIVENIPNMIFLKEEKELRFVLLNRAGEELLGLSRAELIGRNDYDFFPREEADFFTEKDRMVLQSGNLLDIREETIHTSKGVRILHTKKLPISGLGGTRYLLGISEDVTERKQFEEALEKARDEAQKANCAKSEFLAKMSHEIRTPLNAVIGFTDLLLDTPLVTDQREYLREVQNSAQSLLGLIEDIFDFSRIEAGRLTLAKESFSLRDVAADALKGLLVRADAKDLEVNLCIEPDVPDGLIGDPWRLRQIFVNLVGNAIKFTPRGEIVIRIARETNPQADRATLHASVADMGLGIDLKRFPEIFAPFVQADNSSTRRHGGAGLGLAIASHLVEMMGGRIWGESPSPIGTTTAPGAVFHFTADLGVQNPERTVHESLPALAGTSVLVVDPHSISRELMKDLLLQSGGRVMTTSSRDEALRAARDGGFQVALVNGHIGSNDGFEVARAIADAHGPPVILLLSSRELLSRAGAASVPGVVGTILKPPRPNELLRAIKDAISSSRPKPPRAVTAPHPLVRGARALLVEDNPVNQLVARRMLERWGFEVEVAAHGVEALAAVERGAFNVMLLDVQMPVMDGFEVAREVRRREAGGEGHLPIVALTARAMKGDRERCLDAGMDSYVSKPFHAEDLLAALRRVLPTCFTDEPGLETQAL